MFKRSCEYSAVGSSSPGSSPFRASSLIYRWRPDRVCADRSGRCGGGRSRRYRGVPFVPDKEDQASIVHQT
jgi:hypothetical protein